MHVIVERTDGVPTTVMPTALCEKNERELSFPRTKKDAPTVEGEVTENCTTDEFDVCVMADSPVPPVICGELKSEGNPAVSAPLASNAVIVQIVNSFGLTVFTCKLTLPIHRIVHKLDG